MNHDKVHWVEISALTIDNQTSMFGQPSLAQTPDTQTQTVPYIMATRSQSNKVLAYKVVCAPGFKVPLRYAPAITAPINKYLINDDVIFVYEERVSGFFQLEDGSVSLQIFLQKCF